MALQQLVHLLELELVVGVDGDLGVLAFDLRLGTFEVVTLAHLAAHIGERIVDLGKIGLRDDIERRHGSVFALFGSPSALKSSIRGRKGAILRPPRQTACRPPLGAG
jgi:hypothetical protein